jgi:hypothetical protein
MKNRITIRTYPGGSPATGLGYTIYKELDNAVLKTGNTDPNGQFTYDTNLCPGPWRWEAIDNSTEQPSVRRGSTKSYDSAGTYSLYELPYALRILGNGVVANYLGEMAPSAGSGINYSVATGAAVALGIPTTIATAIANQACVTARDAALPKQCYLVLQFEGLGTTEEGKVILTDVCGVAAASPTLPGLTQSDTRWHLPLATFRLPNTGGSTLTQFTDVRTLLGASAAINPQLSSIGRRIDALGSVNVLSTTGADVVWTTGAVTPTLLSGVLYDITTEVSLLVKAPPGQTISIAPYINTTANRATFLDSTYSTDYIQISNSYALMGVLGTGVALPCGTSIKVSATTGYYLTGSQIVTATPR